MIIPVNQKIKFLFFAALLWSIGFVACGEREEVIEYGEGIGGPELSAELTHVSVTKTTGEVIATFDYDPTFWTDVTAEVLGEEIEKSILLVLVQVEEGLIATFVRVIGRSDTSCRFRAAVLARDEEYKIDGSGDFLNTQELKIHRVDIHKEADYQTYYCADLKDKHGIFVTIGGPSVEPLAYKQIHTLINSLKLL